ncbi:hypothetical protein BGX38DRAFT_1188525, partial [Terfezia claveryi]
MTSRGLKKLERIVLWILLWLSVVWYVNCLAHQEDKFHETSWMTERSFTRRLMSFRFAYLLIMITLYYFPLFAY